MQAYARSTVSHAQIIKRFVDADQFLLVARKIKAEMASGTFAVPDASRSAVADTSPSFDRKLAATLLFRCYLHQMLAYGALAKWHCRHSHTRQRSRQARRSRRFQRAD